MRFKNQLIVLWHAFLDRRTPLYLKLVMIAVVAYVISPIDFLPDVFAGIGWIDDALLLAFAVDWIISRLPRDIEETHRRPTNRAKADDLGDKSDESRVIEGTARRQ